jgi:ketosteroid isomerase-like protein
VHLSFGDTSAEEYAWQLIADHVIHGWDLAVAIGADPGLDDELVDRCARWWAGWEDAYRGAGAIGARVPVTPDASAQDQLLGSFGRDPAWSAARAVVDRFGAAWEAWDLDGIVACLAEDAVFESTDPAPDGRRVEGRPAIEAEWRRMFEGTTDPSFTVEDSVVCGDHATVRWRFGWRSDDGTPGHVRGIDWITVADGRIAEKLSYVKG